MSKTNAFIGILPLKLRKSKNIGNIDIVDLISCLEKPQGKIKDLTADDHIIIYPSSKIWFASYSGLKCKVSLIITEPTVIHQRYYKMLWLLRFKFGTIFVRYKALENKYKNVSIIPIVESWIPMLKADDSLSKNRLISIISSEKNTLKGHKLRHQIIKNIKYPELAILGKGYKPFEHKKDGLLPYHFSIVIENCQETDYFTEKLVDSFACKTIPIYWGCPNIANYFDTKGIIIFNTIDELKTILNNLKLTDYDKFLPFLEKNHQQGLKLIDTIKLITDKLKK